MEFCWLRILTGLFILRKEHAFVPERIVRASGEQATLPCESVSPWIRWFWLPLSSRCAEVQSGYVEITWSLTGNEVAPVRFNQRLANQTSGSLVLRNLVMSDSGTYVCRSPDGSETRTMLDVTAGCHNNVYVSFWWLNASSLRLSCRHCRSPGNFKENSFRWMLNSKPLGNERWFEKTNYGSLVQLLSTRRRAWGRWECHSLANHTWVSEICLEPPVRERGAGEFEILCAVVQLTSSLCVKASMENLWSSRCSLTTTPILPGHWLMLAGVDGNWSPKTSGRQVPHLALKTCAEKEDCSRYSFFHLSAKGMEEIPPSAMLFISFGLIRFICHLINRNLQAFCV
ncbi:uncharacterized protein LOC144326199 [Podarcis muralis]